MPKVSVIIPVYNTEKYLRKCLDSVCNQTLSDIEIICINDCSTDNSLNILNEYSKNDNRIKIIDFKDNKGAAVARNTGIDEAKGEYIGFIDSDDFINLDFYEKLYNRAKKTNADAVKGVYKYNQNDFIQSFINQKIYENKNNFVCEYCSAIFLRQLIVSHQLHFPNIKEMEDPVFAFSFALIAKKIEIVNNAIINIVTHSDSQTAGIPSLERINDKLQGLKTMIDMANKSNICETSYGYIFSLWFSVISAASLQNKSFDIKKYFAETIINLSKELKFANSFKQQLSKTDKILLNCINNSNIDELIILNETKKILELEHHNNELDVTIKQLDKMKNKLINQYATNVLGQSKGENIFMISVVNDYKMYQNCICENPFVKQPKNINLIDFDNTKENIYISKRYNSFIENYDYSKEAWFIFCHNDWELQEDINPILNKLDKSCFYGPIGSKIEFINNKIYRKQIGNCFEKRRDGSGYRYLINEKHNDIEITDTFDCQAFIVHSSLIKKYNLRFDENLKWDLYVEDLCINSKLKYNINSYTIKIDCCHWSGYHITPPSYYDSLKYINQKYPDGIWSGMVSLIGGKQMEEATDKDILFSKLRKGMLCQKSQ